MSMPKEFDEPKPGDIVRYMCKHGDKAGYFVKTTADGKVWALDVPENTRTRTSIYKTSVVAVRPRSEEGDIDL